jgi:branched-chain amino acid transport system ATP-binding protein
MPECALQARCAAMTTQRAPVLEIVDAGVAFGGVRALDGVSCHVNDGELCGLVGPNGAGKTTLFNCVTRLYELGQGDIRFAGASLVGRRKREVVGLGIARTFQNLGVYGQMSVLDNVLIGTHHSRRDRFFAPLYDPRLTAAEERRSIDWARQILGELDLDHLADRQARDLPYGTLKRIEVARALAARPRLLLLDEPAAGLTQSEVSAFGEMLRRVRERFALTILLVEHNMRLVMSLCERIIVLHLGRKLAEGTPAQIQGDERVVAAYLGGAVQ